MIPVYERRSAISSVHRPVNMSFPPHLHTHIEMLYVINGEIEMTVGSMTQLIRQGGFSIAFPNQIHSYLTETDQAVSNSIMVLFPVEMGGDFIPLLCKQHPKMPFFSSEQVHEDVSYAMEALAKLQYKSESTSVIKALIQLILARLMPVMSLRQNKDIQPPDQTSLLITYLAEHFLEPVSLDILPTELAISKYNISRIFSEKINTSFCSYINALRIQHARTLLLGTDLDILTISMDCGYETPRTFNREFKKICGITPREYRKTVRL